MNLPVLEVIENTGEQLPRWCVRIALQIIIRRMTSLTKRQSITLRNSSMRDGDSNTTFFFVLVPNGIFKYVG